MESNTLEKISDKYYLIFDTDKLPIDFDKWIQLDTNKVKLKNNLLFLNQYYCVVIDSEIDFFIEMGGSYYIFQKGIKYLPYFPAYHDTYIKIEPGIKIFTDPTIYDYYHIQNNKYDRKIKFNDELSKIFNCFRYVYGELDFRPDDERYGYNLVVENEMSGIRKIIKKNHIDPNELYFDLESNNFKDLIYFIDKYLQYDFLNIYIFRE